MDFGIEKRISNFIESQFPQFYLEEGETFVQFLKAYYEWLESENQPIYQARRLLDYRDIDNTISDFLEYFQKKYLYGVPFNIIINKRFLLKHILDVYRSKGSIQCYRLLFKLIYNQDIEVYLPGNDILKPSDGVYHQPIYIEVTDNEILQSFVGETIIGLTSGVTGVVESYIKQPINGNIVNILYISNINLKRVSFVKGEKIVVYNQINSNSAINAPTILGSLQNLNILDGGSGFKVGDILKIANKNASNNSISSVGSEGIVRVSKTGVVTGALTFVITNGGTGYQANSLTFAYKNESETTGNGASYSIGSISYVQNVQYNNDLILDYANTVLNATSFGFIHSPSANISNTLDNALTFYTSPFGTLATLTNIISGNNYNYPTYNFARSIITSQTAIKNVTFNTGSNTVTGTGTTFLNQFGNNDVIFLQANAGDSSIYNYQVIKNVVSNTSILLYGPPSINSTSNAAVKITNSIFPASFATYDPLAYNLDSSISGLNSTIQANKNTGSDVVLETVIYDSGIGYSEGEIVHAYRFYGVNKPTIISGGNKYTNGDVINFYGGDYSTAASGYVQTNSNGVIIDTTITNYGSGYKIQPILKVKSINGSGANLVTSVMSSSNLVTSTSIVGTVSKTGCGIKPGSWLSTKGFLNSDKYIQDSYFYQDFSYQIKAANTLDKYRDILYNTFHVAGTQLFGDFLEVINEKEPILLVAESNQTNTYIVFSVDSTHVTSDASIYTADRTTT